MIINFEFKRPTYKIVPTFKTIGKGKSKQNVIEKINCVLSFNDGLINVSGIITQKDINESIPQLELLGIDFYTPFVSTFINEFIIKLNNMFNTQLTHDDLNDFYKENQDVFIKFISELKNIINENR